MFICTIENVSSSQRNSIAGTGLSDQMKNKVSNNEETDHDDGCNHSYDDKYDQPMKMQQVQPIPSCRNSNACSDTC